MTEHPAPVDPIVAHLKRRREDAGLTMTALAAKFGASRHMLSNWEDGKQSPTLSNLRLWAQALDEPLRVGHGDDGRLQRVVEELETALARERHRADDRYIDAVAGRREALRAVELKEREADSLRAEVEVHIARVEAAERRARDAEQQVRRARAAASDPGFLARLLAGLDALARNPYQPTHDDIDDLRRAVAGRAPRVHTTEAA